MRVYGNTTGSFYVVVCVLFVVLFVVCFYFGSMSRQSDRLYTWLFLCCKVKGFETTPVENLGTLPCYTDYCLLYCLWFVFTLDLCQDNPIDYTHGYL